MSTVEVKTIDGKVDRYPNTKKWHIGDQALVIELSDINQTSHTVSYEMRHVIRIEVWE